MKFLISLGPNWEEASVSATRVTEKTVPATPIIAPDIVDKMVLAESDPFTKKKRVNPSCRKLIWPSKDTRPTDSSTEKTIIVTGINQKVAFNSPHLNNILFMYQLTSLWRLAVKTSSHIVHLFLPNNPWCDFTSNSHCLIMFEVAFHIG
jgi:hypothetical protein